MNGHPDEPPRGPIAGLDRPQIQSCAAHLKHLKYPKSPL